LGITGVYMIEEEVHIEIDEGIISGILSIPEGAKGIVLFVHGSGSSRFSPRNQKVAKILNGGGIATLLFDLLTPEEERIDDITRELRFNIPMLADRTVKITEWVLEEKKLCGMKIGYFGASTGAAAALIAASKRTEIAAVVSRGGRPDLALKFLPDVKAPTLLIVGGEDYSVIGMNEEAYEKLSSIKKLSIVPGATHLFEERGKLEEVARQALEWFQVYLKGKK
jgi:putative phosphoribosyl transferase